MAASMMVVWRLLKLVSMLCPVLFSRNSDDLPRQGFLGSVGVAQVVVYALRQHDTNFVVMDWVL